MYEQYGSRKYVGMFVEDGVPGLVLGSDMMFVDVIFETLFLDEIV